MLAGEYAVLAGGEAITVPLRLFFASLKQKGQASDSELFKKSTSSLKNLYAYLQKLPEKSFHARSNLSKFNEILKKGYYIDSSIPEGYGIGSSAAVSALVYDQFFEAHSELSLQKQKDDLATIESFFHGKSSGVDALSSFLNQPIHFSANGPELINYINPTRHESGYRFFLLDSRTTLTTAPLVKHFNSKMKETEFRDVITNDLLVLNTKFIGSLLKKSVSDPAKIFRSISNLQWKYFRKMIPESIEDIWMQGQISDLYSLKLNGSGGGFMLGISHKDSRASVIEQISGFELTWL